MATLTRLLSSFSDFLLWPVMALLVLMIARAAFAAGVFAREAAGRRRSPRFAALAAILPGLPRADALRRVEDLELQLARRIDRGHLAARLAPMLGLAGTLIPLGPALHSLGGGDLQAFGEQLVVAFTTTVAGLFVCGVEFAMAAVRARWYEADLRAVERTVAAEVVRA